MKFLRPSALKILTIAGVVVSSAVPQPSTQLGKRLPNASPAAPDKSKQTTTFSDVSGFYIFKCNGDIYDMIDHISGTMTYSSLTNENPPDSVNFHASILYRATGIGSITGAEYNILDNYSDNGSQRKDPGVYIEAGLKFVEVTNFIITAKKSGIVYQQHENVRFVFDSDGVPHLDVNNAFFSDQKERCT